MLELNNKCYKLYSIGKILELEHRLNNILYYSKNKLKDWIGILLIIVMSACILLCIFTIQITNKIIIIIIITFFNFYSASFDRILVSFEK